MGCATGWRSRWDPFSRGGDGGAIGQDKQWARHRGGGQKGVLQVVANGGRVRLGRMAGVPPGWGKVRRATGGGQTVGAP